MGAMRPQAIHQIGELCRDTVPLVAGHPGELLRRASVARKDVLVAGHTAADDRGEHVLRVQRAAKRATDLVDQGDGDETCGSRSLGSTIPLLLGWADG